MQCRDELATIYPASITNTSSARPRECQTCFRELCNQVVDLHMSLDMKTMRQNVLSKLSLPIC
jgi:hypothetical protein